MSATHQNGFFTNQTVASSPTQMEMPTESPKSNSKPRDDRNSPEYLSQLLKDKKQIQAFPNVFVHLERLLDEEITRTRSHLFHFGNQKEALSLPDPQGPIVTLSEKLFVPVKDHPEFNFVGRILGPRGMTAKQLELDTGCKIMVRGKGSMRDKKKEDLNRGKPNWEHLNEELHVLITVEDTRNRAEIKLKQATDEVKRLLVPAPEGEDELKKMQLLELAIINGTYRQGEQLQLAQAAAAAANAAKLQSFAQGQRLLAPAGLPLGFSLSAGLRSPAPAGAPIFLTPRVPTVTTQLTTAASQVAAAPHYMTSQFMNGGPPPLISPTDNTAGLYLASYGAGVQDPYAALASPQMIDYTTAAGLEQTAAGATPKVRRTVGAVASRDHPYMRVSLA